MVKRGSLCALIVFNRCIILVSPCRNRPLLYPPKLEILPANSKSALSSPIKQQENLLGASKTAKTKTTIPTSGKEGSRAAQGAAARALAALPKGMRFSSPKMADTVRAANRRRLVASARTVASNRWATQLGYQDGQEHIRDLK